MRQRKYQCHLCWYGWPQSLHVSYYEWHFWVEPLDIRDTKLLKNSGRKLPSWNFQRGGQTETKGGCWFSCLQLSSFLCCLQSRLTLWGHFSIICSCICPLVHRVSDRSTSRRYIHWNSSVACLLPLHTFSKLSLVSEFNPLETYLLYIIRTEKILNWIYRCRLTVAWLTKACGGCFFHSFRWIAVKLGI